MYDAICKGCDLPCDKCELPGNVPICSPAPDHTSSDGGDATVETLLLSDGYWRPSPTSMDIRECFNEAACLGGLTGDPGFCVANYEGPCEWIRLSPNGGQGTIPRTLLLAVLDDTKSSEKWFYSTPIKICWRPENTA